MAVLPSRRNDPRWDKRPVLCITIDRSKQDGVKRISIALGELKLFFASATAIVFVPQVIVEPNGSSCCVVNRDGIIISRLL